MQMRKNESTPIFRARRCRAMRCHSLSSSATFLSLAFGFWHKGKNVLTLFHTSMTKMFQFYTHAKAATPVRTTSLKSWFRLKISNFAVCAFWYTYGRGRHILNSYAQITFNKRIPDKMCGYTKCKNERELNRLHTAVKDSFVFRIPSSIYFWILPQCVIQRG